MLKKQRIAIVGDALIGSSTCMPIALPKEDFECTGPREQDQRLKPQVMTHEEFEYLNTFNHSPANNRAYRRKQARLNRKNNCW